MIALPLVDRVLRTVLPLTVSELDSVGMLTLPAKVARPLLSMVKRSTSTPLLPLMLPVALVLNMRLPPNLPVASCKFGHENVTDRAMLLEVSWLVT